MGKDHTNIRDDVYEMPGGKCAADYKGQDYTKILEGNAPNLDMGSAPKPVKGVKIKNGEKGKK